MTRFLGVLFGTILVALVLALMPPQKAESQERMESAGGNNKIIKSERAIPNRYIVVLEDWAAGERGGQSNSRGVADELQLVYGGRIDRVFRHAVNGYSAEMSERQADALSRDLRVKYIEEDGEMFANATQNNATWGLDRIDQRDMPLNGTYIYNATGAGVRAYIIDSGIRSTHNEFTGRVQTGYTAISDGRGTDDCNGHGTHVAGTTGGTVYGVAKSITFVPVRVLNCQGSGTTSGVIAGVDWVTANHVKPAVANMSLGGGASSSLDTAVDNSISAGITYAVAAGNDNLNACNYSPARVATAITVGATTNSDARASYSNFGSCLDIFAPGSSITSAWDDSNTATATISGTSMASPHVAGVAALYLEGNPSASPASVRSAIVGNATSGKVTSAGTGSVNLLLYSGFIGGGGGNLSPTSSFTFSCTDVTCSFDGSGSSDSDGSISSYSWNFGDGTNGSGSTVSKTFGAAGTYTVTLTVTDNDAATGSQSQNVTVSSSGGGGITISVLPYKVKGSQRVDVTWSGAGGTTVDIFRNTTKITTANDGFHTDDIGVKGGGSYTYRVCEAGTSICSVNATASF
ncbi:MAG: S8 family serine peptidase [Blastocatellia bacterium]|nr:S8 family serine peptidase [Blastocatellia bacterium]